MNKKANSYWRGKLSNEVYRVCREQETEPPFSGKLLHNHQTGIYSCVCCHTGLFSSANKYDSGCGWPSFDAPLTEDCIDYIEDKSHGMVRVEIRCSQCDSHLGHVFTDGPAPTGQRFCVNSVSLIFKDNI